MDSERVSETLTYGFLMFSVGLKMLTLGSNGYC